jgi:hemerythrin-like domain-containing protein
MASKKAAAAKKSAAPDAIKLLKTDHENVRTLLGQFENATGAKREKLRATIERELKVHTQIEEEIFYPAYRTAARKKEDQKLYYEALEEHHVVDLVLPQVGNGANPEQLKAKAKVLKELVEHHADEEEKEMFPRAKKVLSKEELRALGEQMQLRKESLLAKR